jgi:Kef-type K+ transport system membrane component KefB
MTLIQNLLVLLLSAHLLGRLAERIKQPALLGHMLAGVVLGPIALRWIGANTALGALADLAVLFVVVTAGLEMRMKQVLQTFRGRGGLALLPSFLLPLALGFAFAVLSGEAMVPGVVVGLCISVTALPVALRILSGFGMTETPIARVSISGALLSDCVVFVSLGALTAATSASLEPQVLRLAGIAAVKILALIGLVIGGSYACKWLIAATQRRFAQHRRFHSSQLMVSLLFILSIAAASEALGFHFAIGAFLASLMVSEQLNGTDTAKQLRHSCKLMTDTVFGPLFLAYQGLQFTVSGLAQPAFALGLIAIAIVSKLIGGYFSARLSSLGRRDAYGVAIVMNARGVMEMVIASIAYRTGLIDQNLFSMLLLMGVATTVCTPLLLKEWQKRGMNRVEADARAAPP